MPLCNWPRPLFVESTMQAGGYANYGSGWATCGYYRDPDGFVHLKGLFAYPAGSYAAWAPVQMPVGFRPAAQPIFLHMGSYAGATYPNVSFREDVQADGLVYGTWGQGLGWTGGYASMDNITYQAVWGGA